MTNPRPIRRINIWGGPGCGKSTVAADIFATFKKGGCSIEYTQEYVKAWAYEKREFSSFDQVYIFAKQQRLEDRVLRAGVQTIITDSPLLMQCVYGKRMNALGWEELLSIGKKFETQYKSINYLLSRSHDYQAEGRYQDEKQAKELDNEIELFLHVNDIPHSKINYELQKDIIVPMLMDTLHKQSSLCRK